MLRAVAAASTETAETASSPSEQLARGFRWLRFKPDLEAAYRADQFRDGRKFLRVNLAMLAVILLILFQIDHAVIPEVRDRVPMFARFGVMVPALAIAYLLTYVRRADIWYPRVMSVLMPVTLMIIAVLGLWAWQLGEPRLFVRLIVATIAFYFVLGIPVRSAAAGNLVIIVFYMAMAVGLGMPGAQLAHYASMLVIGSIICAAGAYNLEHAHRTAWLEGRLLAETALQDGLTGIPNRRRLDEHLQRIWQQCTREHKPIALLFGDIDHFKRYNDQYGHQAGDEALKSVAAVIARHARRPLDIAARFGGEEFALVLYDTTPDHARRTGEQILEEVRQLGITHATSGVAPVLTISIGIACVIPAARRSCAGLLQLADQALYAAKDGGRNQAQLLEGEYEHMKTGYFHRSALGDRPEP